MTWLQVWAWREGFWNDSSYPAPQSGIVPMTESACPKENLNINSGSLKGVR
jgi:hypothetical protein